MSSGGKPILAVVTSRFPYPLEKGDKLRLFYQLKGLSTFFSIILIAIGESRVEKTFVEKVRTHVDEIHYFRLSPWRRFWNLRHSLFSGLPFQVAYFYDERLRDTIQEIFKDKPVEFIFCQLARMAPYCHEISVPVTLDYMDAFGVGMERRAKVAKGLMKWIYNYESSRMKIYEKHLLHCFHRYAIISEQDKKCIPVQVSEQIEVLPNGIDESFFTRVDENLAYDLVFVGNMGYLPNIEAAEFLVNKILPLLPKNTTVLIAGARPHPRVMSLKSDNVCIGGWFDDIRKAYCSALIFVAPLWSGTGQQNKILEAMAQGLPCVTTPAVNNAIGAVSGENILLATDVISFVEQINYLLENKSSIFNIGSSAKKFVKQNFSWNDSVFKLKNLILSSDSKKHNNDHGIRS